jgi:hypothetical protein
MKKKDFSKVKNPNGPYKMDISYWGKSVNVVIDNEGPFDFKVKIKSKSKLNPEFINNLKEYLEAEGFYELAQRHNLHW